MSKKKITICVLLLAIGTIAFLPCLTFQEEKQEFAESNEMLAVFLGEEKSKTFPAKEDGYIYDHTECTNDEVATWDASSWKLSITKIKKETKCNVYFVVSFTEKEFAYKGSVEKFVVPVTGNYKLEVWGAKGGSHATNLTATSGSGEPGAGGYSVGTAYLEAGTTLYVYVGGEGKAEVNGQGGFNGGGNSRSSSSNQWNGGSGGGATDIRIGEDTLFHRVIVAGGGGGLAHWIVAPAGAGGGTSGIGGGKNNSDNTTSTPGTQYSGGKLGYYNTSVSSAPHTEAAFGAAGNFDQDATGNYEGAGGGGGWYGGGSGVYVSAAGGSGWIYTEAAYNIWKSSNPDDANEYKLDSKYYLKNANTLVGTDTTIPEKTTLDGNGYAKITLVR